MSGDDPRMLRRGILPLEGRRALVTGASRGIGAAIAVLFARAGARVAINYRTSEAAARDVLDEVLSVGGDGIVVAGDVLDPADSARMVETTCAEFGGIDLLVSNAAIGFPIKPFLDMEWDDFGGKLEGELRAAFGICQPAARAMAADSGGDIVLVSSMLGQRPVNGFIAHGTAKAGLVTFARYLAKELGPLGIKTNVVAPGLVETDATSGIPVEATERIRLRTPLRRRARPEDVAGAVLGVVSNVNPHMNGAYVPVNGGADMR